MRILLTATAATDQRLDGITLFARSLAAHLSADGANACALFVSDVHHHPANPSLTRAATGGIELFRAALPEPRTPEEALDAPGCAGLFRQAIADFRPDVIHFHALELLSAGMIEVAAEQKAPTVMTLHDFYLICPGVRLLELDGTPCAGPERGERCGACLAATGHLTGRYRGLRRWLTRRWDVRVRRRYAASFRSRFSRLEHVAAQLDAVVCPSRYLGDRTVRAGMIEDYELIPNGSELGPLPPREGAGPLVLGMLAHHSYSKGTLFLVKALRSARELAVRLRVYGAGDPRYLAAARKLAQGDNRISFEGPFAPSDVREILSGLDTVAVPSLCPETYSLVAHDAVAAGRPCIVPSDSGATESVVDGRHGFHFRRGSAASLAEALRKLAADPQLPARLRGNILQDRPVISRAEVAGRYLALYNKVAASERDG